MHYNPRKMLATLKAAKTINEFEDWLRTDSDRLLAAAELLGGHKWRTRAHAVLDALCEGAEIASQFEELTNLFRLLSLEFTDDLNSDEAALFFAVHPDDPRADDARICAEALQRGLAAIQLFSPTTSLEAA